MRGQDSLKLNINDGDISYQGVLIPLKLVKKALLQKYPEVCFEYRLKSSRKFNTKTGEIHYLYAWDSIIDKMHSTPADNEDRDESYISILDNVLHELIQDIDDD